MNNSTIIYGCDNCGEAVPAIKAGRFFPNLKQWQHVYLCNNCIVILQKENKKMKQGRTREEYLNSFKK